MSATSFPDSPGHSQDDTSIAAAESVEAFAPKLRDQVLMFLRERPATVHECARALNEPVPSIQPRFSELRARGMIVDTGVRRLNDSGRNAIVWSAPTSG
jgi:predicted transcriptional regulator